MHPLLRQFFVLVLVAGYLPCLAAGSPELLNGDSLRPVFRLSPKPSVAPPESQLSLHLLRDRDTADVAVAAAYSARAGGLEMTLLTELDYGAAYVLKWQSVSGSHAVIYRTPSRPVSKPAALLARYPQVDTVPANLLLMQFRFDAPMRPDPEVWTRIHIREDRDDAAEIPFAWRQRCFWLDSNRVLQLMIHPGRVKTGIHYGGPLLIAGRSYRIDIDSGFVDAHGNVLGPLPVQRLTAAPEDRTMPVVEVVTIALAAASLAPVAIRFSERMDYSGALTGIRIIDSKGADRSFEPRLSADGRTISLYPERPWEAGRYRLELNAELRDSGANTLRRMFEVRNLKAAAKDRVPLTYELSVL
jgi:hypothetical protein